jgi:uncharacterized lipoprotein YajG
MYLSDVERVYRMPSDYSYVGALAGQWMMTGCTNAKGSSAQFSSPMDLVVDSSNVLYVADTMNDTIRQVAQDGDVTTFAGACEVRGSADGPVASARFKWPTGLAIGPSGEIYVVDQGNHTIRKIQ